MTKGTPSMGRKASSRLHYKCRRCGNSSYHRSKKVCSFCGFGASSKIREYAWQKKTFSRKAK